MAKLSVNDFHSSDMYAIVVVLYDDDDDIYMQMEKSEHFICPILNDLNVACQARV